ncbi:adenosine-specific kinase [Candidatus Bathyarchaeota archaeon]|nr:adenosine-specific kinase [Candidatus Bathyarchaeota archaeon]
MELFVIKLDVPNECNLILAQSHFIKTVEDTYDALASSTPGIKFGIAFCEASGDCLIRHDGNDEFLREEAAKNALKLSCGHSLLIYIKNAYPINLLTQLKMVPEICNIYVATANPIEIVIAETDQGRGILGIIDGYKSKGIENDEGIKWRKELLRKIGYKT